MPKRIESRDHSGSAGFNHWKDTVADLFVALEATTDDRDAFRMQVQRSMLGEIMCAINASSQQHLFRTPGLIARGSEDCVAVLLVEAGSTVVIQDDRQTLCQHGDFVLLDTSRSYELENSPGTEQIVFQIPRKLILGRIGNLSESTATRYSYDRPINRLTYDFLKTLAHGCSTISEDLMPMLTGQGMDLLAVSLHEAQQGKHLSRSTHRSALLYRLKHCIQSQIADPELTIEQVATRLAISPRYVNNLLADENISFRQYVLTCRLERCRQDLSLQNHAHRRIGEIAYAWGFNDLAHFSKVYKTRFGHSPRDWRERERLLAAERKLPVKKPAER